MEKDVINKLLDEIQQKELLEFRSNLPFDEKYFPKLFNFVDQKLSNTTCTKDYKFTKIFCDKNKLDFEKLLIWLTSEENSSSCDCEILNLEDAFQYLIPKKKIVIKKKEFTIKKLPNLKTDFGFTLTKVVNPWQLKEITKKNEVNYVFQLGNKEGHNVSFAEMSTILNFGNDDFLKSNYSETTELDFDLDFVIDRATYKNFEYVIVKTIRWAPIVIYFKQYQSDNWVLKLQTEISRYKNDLKEFNKILDHII